MYNVKTEGAVAKNYAYVYPGIFLGFLSGRAPGVAMLQVVPSVWMLMQCKSRSSYFCAEVGMLTYDFSDVVHACYFQTLSFASLPSQSLQPALLQDFAGDYFCTYLSLSLFEWAYLVRTSLAIVVWANRVLIRDVPQICWSNLFTLDLGGEWSFLNS